MTQFESRSDEDLVTASLNGDSVATALLVKRYVESIYDFTIRVTLDPEAAASATENTFARLSAELAGRPEDLSFSAWLHGLSRDEALESMRQRARDDEARPGQLSPMDARFLHPSRPGETDAAAWAWGAARGQRPRDYSILDLLLRRQLTPEEIADIASLSRNGVYGVIGRLRGGFEESFIAAALFAAGRQRCRELASIVGDGPSLGPALRREISRHAETCPNCQKTKASLPEGAEVFATLQPVAIPDDLADRLLPLMLAAGAAAADAAPVTEGQPAAAAEAATATAIAGLAHAGETAPTAEAHAVPAPEAASSETSSEPPAAAPVAAPSEAGEIADTASTPLAAEHEVETPPAEQPAGEAETAPREAAASVVEPEQAPTETVAPALAEAVPDEATAAATTAEEVPEDVAAPANPEPLGETIAEPEMPEVPALAATDNVEPAAEAEAPEVPALAATEAEAPDDTATEERAEATAAVEEAVALTSPVTEEPPTVPGASELVAASAAGATEAPRRGGKLLLPSTTGGRVPRPGEKARRLAPIPGANGSGGRLPPPVAATTQAGAVAKEGPFAPAPVGAASAGTPASPAWSTRAGAGGPPAGPFDRAALGDREEGGKRKYLVYAAVAVGTAIALYLGIAVGDSLQTGGGGGRNPAAAALPTRVSGVPSAACPGPVDVNQGSRVALEFPSAPEGHVLDRTIGVQTVSAAANLSLVEAIAQQGNTVLFSAAQAPNSAGRTDEYRLTVNFVKDNDRKPMECTVRVIGPAAPAATATPAPAATNTAVPATPTQAPVVVPPTSTPAPPTATPDLSTPTPTTPTAIPTAGGTLISPTETPTRTPTPVTPTATPTP